MTSNGCMRRPQPLASGETCTSPASCLTRRYARSFATPRCSPCRVAGRASDSCICRRCARAFPAWAHATTRRPTSSSTETRASSFRIRTPKRSPGRWPDSLRTKRCAGAWATLAVGGSRARSRIPGSALGWRACYRARSPPAPAAADMCGIVAALGVRNPARVVAAMSAALSHRGPDDDGACALSGTAGEAVGAFAHRRLSILDLTVAGHQPMTATNDRFALAFNGEIYNFRSLRAELEHAGVRFRSTSDTEVLLEGWARLGPAFVQRLEGMFAFVLWDVREQALFVARDPFGIKPLYVAEVDGGVLAASELRALLASDLVPARVDSTALASYLTFGSV